jgi:SAM-dependent methyltransferase
VDVEPTVLSNEDLDEAHLIDGIHLPYPDGYFDAVYSDWTMEHVEQPDLLLREVHRVLRPGASYWFKTSNLHHYVTLVSAMTPHRFHVWLLRTAGIRTDRTSTWPTYYRCNTRAKVQALTARAGFSTCEFRMVEPEPTYLTFSRLAFMLGVAYERLVNRSVWLAEFRLILLSKATKAPVRGDQSPAHANDESPCGSLPGQPNGEVTQPSSLDRTSESGVGRRRF